MLFTLFILVCFVHCQCDAGVPPHAQRICTGNYHVCVLSPDNFGVKCWGAAYSGALGYGNTAPDLLAPPLQYVNVGANVSGICCQTDSTCALTIDGDVKCWGRNNLGQLGAGNTISTGDDPSRLPANFSAIYVGSGANASALRVTQLVCGYWFACVLRADHRVRCWGRNFHGQTGLGIPSNPNIGDDEALSSFVEVDVGGDVAALAAGDDHVLALLKDVGRVVAWGKGVYGVLARGSSANIGSIDHPSDFAPLTFPANANAVAVFAGGSQSFVLCDDNNLYGYGANDWGQLGYPIAMFMRYGTQPGETSSAQLPLSLNGNEDDILSVAAGHETTCVILRNRITSATFTRCFGRGLYGARCSQNSLHSWDVMANDSKTLVAMETTRTPLYISCGYFYCYILFTDGCLKSWGLGQYGRTGRGNEDDFCDEAGEYLANSSCLDVFSLLLPPTPASSPLPSPSPTRSPSSQPTPFPTPLPTASPTRRPSSSSPSSSPTASPTSPSLAPTMSPTSPTKAPTLSPTATTTTTTTSTTTTSSTDLNDIDITLPNTMFDSGSSSTSSSSQFIIIIILLVLGFVAILCIAGAVFFRFSKRSRDVVLRRHRRHGSRSASAHSSKRSSFIASSKRTSVQLERGSRQLERVSRQQQQGLSVGGGGGGGGDEHQPSNYVGMSAAFLHSRNYNSAPSTDDSEQYYENLPVSTSFSSNSIDNQQPHYEQLQLSTSYAPLSLNSQNTPYVELKSFKK